MVRKLTIGLNLHSVILSPGTLTGLLTTAGWLISLLKATAFKTCSFHTSTPVSGSTGICTFNSSTLCKCLSIKPAQFNSIALATNTALYQRLATTTIVCLTLSQSVCNSQIMIIMFCSLLLLSHGTTELIVKLKSRLRVATR